jgi:hypothetical protein
LPGNNRIPRGRLGECLIPEAKSPLNGFKWHSARRQDKNTSLPLQEPLAVLHVLQAVQAVDSDSVQIKGNPSRNRRLKLRTACGLTALLNIQPLQKIHKIEAKLRGRECPNVSFPKLLSG